MKHLNCFVLEGVARSLEQEFRGKQLTDCFSNSPDDIVFLFGDSNLRCIFYSGEIFFRFNDPEVTKSRLFKPQFSELQHREVLMVDPHRFERSFQIEFSDGHKLVFKCHGRSSNILLFKDTHFLDMFRLANDNDRLLLPTQFQSKPSPTIQDFQANQLAAFINQHPFLPEELIAEINESTDQNSLNDLCARYSNIGGFELNEDLSLRPVFNRKSLPEDINHFTSVYLKSKRFLDKKNELLNKFEKEIKDKTAFLNSNQNALEIVENKRNDEEIGHIILAGLHQIKPGSDKTTLNDIYNNTSIEITLDSKLNPVENAEKYFRKAKGIPHTIKLLKNKINQAEQKLSDLNSGYQKIKQAFEWKDLKSFIQNHSKQDVAEELPFRTFQEQGYTIYVGKNADSNEKILNYYSDKDDIWLHAKDVSGSHVLIRCGKNSKLPDSVLERAAALAAYYSKNRNQSLVTVTYTLRKFVRKIKGAEKGKVTVSSEKTLLIKPSL